MSMKKLKKCNDRGSFRVRPWPPNGTWPRNPLENCLMQIRGGRQGLAIVYRLTYMRRSSREFPQPLQKTRSRVTPPGVYGASMSVAFCS